MAKDKELPSEQNSHEENVKISLESILNQKVNSRKVKKSAEDLRKDTFTRAIVALEAADVKEIMLEDVGVNAEGFTQSLWEAVDELFSLLYTPNQLKFIDFYLYSRFDEEGELKAISLPNGQELFFSDPGVLYEFIKAIK
jgi:hypothetical protein